MLQIERIILREIALPLKEPVLEKWLYKNAQRFFRR